MSATIIRGDARNLPLPDASVDLVVTSPPYYQQRVYQDAGESLAGQIGLEATPAEYIASLLECTREWMRILKPTGSIWVNLGDTYSQRTTVRRSAHQDGLHPDRPGVAKAWANDRVAGLARMPRENITNLQTGRYVPEKSLIGLPWRYALSCIDELGLILRAEVVWAKSAGMPESVRDRPRRLHETWLHLVQQRAYYADLDPIRVPHAAPSRTAGATAFGARNRHHVRTGTGAYTGPRTDGVIPGTVWTVAPGAWRAPAHLGAEHHAAFPPDLVRPIVLGWSPEGGAVLDPFGGTGTVALVADAHGRRGISVDRSADYCRLAAWRTTDPGERARALGLPKPAKPIDGQTDLFEATA
jgi:DNA modification methylase